MYRFPAIGQGSIKSDSPPNNEPGMIALTLDAKGRLVALEARPPALSGSAAQPVPFDWAALFTASGLEPARFTPATPQQTPPMALDARMAWTGTFAEGRKEHVRLEAASWQGRPVYFTITGDWQQSVRPPAVAAAGAAFLLLFVLIGAGLVAWKMWMLRRFGLLAVLTDVLMPSVLSAVSPSFSSWYSGRYLTGLGIAAGVAVWALWVILSAQRRPGTESVA